MHGFLFASVMNSERHVNFFPQWSNLDGTHEPITPCLRRKAARKKLVFFLSCCSDGPASLDEAICRRKIKYPEKSALKFESGSQTAVKHQLRDSNICGLTRCCAWFGVVCVDSEPSWIPRWPYDAPNKKKAGYTGQCSVTYGENIAPCALHNLAECALQNGDVISTPPISFAVWISTQSNQSINRLYCRIILECFSAGFCFSFETNSDYSVDFDKKHAFPFTDHSVVCRLLREDIDFTALLEHTTDSRALSSLIIVIILPSSFPVRCYSANPGMLAARIRGGLCTTPDLHPQGCD